MIIVLVDTIVFITTFNIYKSKHTIISQSKV